MENVPFLLHFSKPELRWKGIPRRGAYPRGFTKSQRQDAIAKVLIAVLLPFWGICIKIPAFLLPLVLAPSA